MAYRDPYAGNYGSNNYGETYNPYESSSRQPHGTYDQSGYGNYGGSGAGYYRDYQDSYRDDNHLRGDDYYNNTPQRQATQRTHRTNVMGYSSEPKDEDQTSGFDRGEFNGSTSRGEKGAFRSSSMYDSKEGLWTKGGKGACLGRFCCCTIMITLLLIISILGALALWIRPPSIDIGDPQPQGSGSNSFQISKDGIKINLGIDINVNNPNYFSVNFQSIKAELFYPIDNLPIGGGNASNVQFPSHTQKDYTFPFSVDYKLASDPQSKVLKDILTKCPDKSSQLTIDYKITVQVKILFIPVSPVVSNSVKFNCPFGTSDLGSLLGGSGGADISGILGG